MAKYRRLFLEECTEHLAEISSAMLALEKDAESADSIDLIFRMAHSLKSMAASLEYDSVTELAHALEDRMEGVRRAGRLSGSSDMQALFRGLEGLEAMVAVVRDTGEAPPPQPELVAAVRGDTSAAAPEQGETVHGAEPASPEPAVESPKKKVLR